ncbi:MAG: hypothetical protein H0T46_06640, partial [Deltaproteobacteria bacterium]|nr:hypothetical protein [Deltaproteobacteria bacterium]
MRSSALIVLVAAGCASGKSASDVDASEAVIDAFVMPDSSCGALPCDAIHVSRSGNDTAAGTKTAPMKSINAAITKASTAVPPLAVFVHSGVYPESFTMKSGVSVYGGFDDAWTQNPSVTTEIASPTSPAVTIDNIMVPTLLVKMTIKTPDAISPGASSVAITITGSKMVELRDLQVLPGIGAAGTDGIDGSVGAGGGNGAGGNPGVERSGG